MGPFGVNGKEGRGDFLQLITGKTSRRLGYRTWETTGTKDVRETERTQSARIYIEQRQETVAQWVALRPLFQVCTREIGYEGGERRRKAWWRQ